MKNFYTLLFGGLLFCLAGNLSGQTFTVGLTDAQGDVGEEVCLNLVGANFVDVVGMQFTMLFDTSALEFVSASGSINGATVSIINPSFFPTEIRLSYSPFSSTGYTDAGPFTFGTICFRIKRDVATVVAIDADPDLFEYTVVVAGSSQTFGPDNAIITNGNITGGSGGGATCTDGIQNGDETGVDCGGSCSACPPTPTCTDGIQNGDETGVDCGGSCSACPPTPTCTDGIQNGDETGVDCGGSCAPCATMNACGMGSSLFHLCGASVCDVAVGGQACIDLTVANFTDITAVQLDLLYPGANLNYASTTAHPAIGNSLTANQLNDGQVRLLFFRSADSPVNLPDGAAFATVCFTNETAAATTITLDRPRVTSTTTDNLQSVLNDGSVNDCGNTTPTCTDGIQNGDETGVDCGGSCQPCMTSSGDCGEGSDRFNLCVSDACDIAIGGQACVDLSVSMFTNITGFQVKLFYPGANLDYTNFTNVHPALGEGLQVNMVNDGEVRLFFFRAADMPATVPDGESIVSICFTNQTTATTIIDAAQLVVTDADGDVTGPIANDGMVNGCTTAGETCSDGIMNNGETGIDCGGPNCATCPTTTCGEGTTAVDFCLGSVCGDAGAEVCVPVRIGNFNALGGLQFSLAFTAANLNYTRFIPSPNLAGTTVLPPNDADGNPIDGILNFIWADLNGLGVTFPADEPIVELCFTVENTNVTPITFRDPTTEVRAVDVEGTRLPFRLNPGAVNQNCGGMETCSDGIQNNGETGVDCGGPNCVPCTTTCGENTNLLSVCIGQTCDVAVGSQTCVNLTVGNFDNVTGFQFRIFYPGANLNYASFTSNPALGDPLQVNEFNDGQVRAFFFDSDQLGVTLADGESLGTVCFTNEFDGQTILDGANMVATNTTGDVIGPIINDGSINGCTAAPSCTNGIKDGDEEGIDCGGSCPDVCETCTDGIMNQDETGVDCGGSCGPCQTGSVSFSVGSGTAQIGQQVCVSVTVADFASISTVGLTLGYNGASLSLASVTANSALPGFGAANFNTSTTGQIVVSYMPASPQTLANGEELFEVCFNVTGPDESPLTITNAAATNNMGTALTVNTNNGVINAGGVIVYDELSLVASNESGAVGTEVCVDVNVYNLDNLAGLQFAIDYDETKLEFTRAISTEELPGLQVANTGGILRVVWFDPNVGSNSVEDGLAIVAVCFNVLEACETPIEITDQPPGFRVRATTPDDELVQVDLFEGSVNAGVSCGPIGTPPNLVLDLGSGSGPVGTEVCVDLKVTNFTSLTQLAFSVSHDTDPNKVTFSRAINFGLPSLTAANVGAPVNGRVVLNWNASVGTGQSLPAGATLVTLCYFVNRLEVAPLNFSNSPTTIQARNANNQNVGVIPSGGAINPDAPNVDGLTFQIGSASAGVGEEICLPIIGFQAFDLVGFQYTISFDPTKLEYIGTGPDYALDGFNDGAVNNSLPGALSVVWTSPSAIPQTLGDGRALFFVCFRVLSTDLTLVTFNDEPTDIEFENANGILGATLLNGQVNGSPAPTIVAADIRSPRCEGGNSGSIALTVSGGNNLVYQWLPNVSSGATATNLAAGTYSVTVTNPSTTQSTTQTYTVNDGATFNIEVADVAGVSCNGDRDGRILIATVGPDTGPYIFDWSGTLPDDGPEQINLDAGSYSVTVTNANGCVRSLTNIQIGEPQPLAIAGSPNDILPAGMGGVTIQVNGGSRPFSYAWTGPNAYSSDQEDINDVTEAGTYCLTVTDNNNCTSTQCFAVINALAIVSTEVNVGCAGEGNCSIDIEVVGGNGNYDFEWSFGGMVISGDQNLLLTDCQFGDYTLRVTSGADVITQVIELEAPAAIVVGAMVTPATMGNNGSIVLSPSGGNSPYTFDWGGGITNQNRDNLMAGEYCVTITDNSSCTADTCFMVGASAVSILEVLTTQPSCSDAADGSIQLALNNAVAPVNVRIVPLSIDSNYTTTNLNVTVPAGTWRVFLTDAQGAQLDTLVTVTGPAAVSATSNVTSDTEDTGCSGMISLNITGGTAPYTVAWAGGLRGATISSLCAGDYTPTVTDVNGCTFVGAAITVGRIDEELVAITDVACADGTEGGIDITVAGGVTPYTFAWRRDGNPEVIANTEDITGQTSGDYTLTITDATGAVLVKNYTVGISAGFNVTTQVTSDYNGFGVSCVGAADGRIVITLSGQGNFMYEFLLDGLMVGIDSVLENAVAGVYTVAVIDDGGCEIIRTVEVTAPPALTLSGDVTNISCGSTGDGSISVLPSGGVPTYTFLWSTGATTARVTGLRAGNYDVTVTDANGCTSSESFLLTGPEDLAITLEATEANDGCNGSIRILPLGGSGNYRYTWPQLPNQGNNPFAEGLCPGIYTIEVTDDNECQTVTMTATVLDRSLPCLDVRKVITPDGDGLNEKFVIFCSDGDEAIDNNLQIFNRWGQLVYKVNDYDCTDLGGINCFEGETNDGALLPEGPYYYVFEFTSLGGDQMQQRGSLTIIRD